MLLNYYYLPSQSVPSVNESAAVVVQVTVATA